MGIMRMGYIQMRVTDVEAARSHYSDTLGMAVSAEQDGKVYLKGWDEWDHHSVVLEPGGVGVAKIGWKVRRVEDIEAAEKALSQFGVTVERMSKGDNLAIGDGIRWTAPSDHVMELYADAEYIGMETGVLNPDAWPRHLRGVGVPRLDHALITADDPALMERMFVECFDWSVAERLITDPAEPETLATWLFAGQTPHDLAILKGPQGKIHHFAFALGDWNDVLKAADIFSMDDVPIDVGPTRHGITRGTTIYFFDPAGNRNEVFAGGYLTHADFPTITWTADQIGKGIFYHSRMLNEAFTTVFT